MGIPFPGKMVFILGRGQASLNLSYHYSIAAFPFRITMSILLASYIINNSAIIGNFWAMIY